MTNDTTPVGYYEHLEFNNPMTDQTAGRLVTRLATTKPADVTDIGCGWAELLLRLLTACPEANGHGIDHDDILLERAKRNAADRSLSSRVRFSPTVKSATPSDIVICVGAEHVFGNLTRAISELWKLVNPGGTALLGTQIWEQPPSANLVEVIGEVPTLDELVTATVQAGWRPLDLMTASLDDWDHFEFGFLADWEQFVMSTNSEEARNAADLHRDSYLARRGVLGFAFLTLGRPVQSSDAD